MRPHIPPIPIQPHLRRRCPGPSHLKHPAGNPERRIRRHNLHARHPLRHLAPLRRRDVALGAVMEVDIPDFVAGDVGEGFGGAEMREVGAVLLQDELFVGAGCDGLGGVGPGARVFGRVVGAVVEGA